MPGVSARRPCSTCGRGRRRHARGRRRRRGRGVEPAAAGASTATSDVGRLKVDSARERIAEVNPLVRVQTHAVRLDSATRWRSCAATTSWSTAPTTSRRGTWSTTRARCSGIPCVWGSIYRFDGQASVWFAGHGPCYRCVFPEPPPPGPGAVLRRGWRARRAVRGHRVDPGDRGGQARHRRSGTLARSDGSWSTTPCGRPGGRSAVRADPDCALCGSDADGHRARRLRGLLRAALCRNGSGR